MTSARTRESVTRIRRRPGVVHPIDRRFATDDLGPLVTSTAAVAPDDEVVLDGELEATGSDVVLTGTVGVPWEGECRRCLTDVAGTVETPVREVFSPHPVDGETWPIVDDGIDLAAVVRDLALLALPLVPLCRPDCEGPDPERFPTTVEDDAPHGDDRPDGPDHDDAPRDPRWAALDQLRFD